MAAVNDRRCGHDAVLRGFITVEGLESFVDQAKITRVLHEQLSTGNSPGHVDPATLIQMEPRFEP